MTVKVGSVRSGRKTSVKTQKWSYLPQAYRPGQQLMKRWFEECVMNSKKHSNLMKQLKKYESKSKRLKPGTGDKIIIRRSPMDERENLLESIRKALQALYPHGHQGFIPLTIEEMELHSKKNFDYAGGGKPTGNFDRVGAIVSMYPNINWGKPQNVAMFYALKQLDAYLWLENGDRDGAVEGKDARLGDISVYVKIMKLIMRDEKEAK